MFGLWDLLSPLFDFLKCLVIWAVGMIEFVLLSLVNGVISGLMALVTVALMLLPRWDPPLLSELPFVAQLNWLFPIDQLVIATTLVVTVLLVWHVAAVALRWAKVVP